MRDNVLGRATPWERVDKDDPRTPLARRAVAGRWRQDGTPMHGIYQRPRPDGRVEGVAVWHGWPQHAWAGPAMPRFASPLVSAWNPVLAQALQVCGAVPGPGGDHEAWTAEALLAGWKPLGYFGGPRREWAGWADDARAAGLAVHTQPYLVNVCQIAARTETYGELFDLDDLAADYAAALPAEVADPQIEALDSHRGRSPAEYVDRFDALENGPSAILGLTLGYPPSVTAGNLLGYAWGHYAEYGALPNPTRREQVRFAASRATDRLWGQAPLQRHVGSRS